MPWHDRCSHNGPNENRARFDLLCCRSRKRHGVQLFVGHRARRRGTRRRRDPNGCVVRGPQYIERGRWHGVVQPILRLPADRRRRVRNRVRRRHQPLCSGVHRPRVRAARLSRRFRLGRSSLVQSGLRLPAQPGCILRQCLLRWFEPLLDRVRRAPVRRARLPRWRGYERRGRCRRRRRRSGCGMCGYGAQLLRQRYANVLRPGPIGARIVRGRRMAMRSRARSRMQWDQLLRTRRVGWLVQRHRDTRKRDERGEPPSRQGAK
jgi:hypothetical protein